jgi:hypothetical protein
LIDFIKILIKDNPAKFVDNPLLDFYDNINLTTGEIKTTNRQGKEITPYKNSLFNGLEFKIYDTGTIYLSGSLHKFYNSGAHNYNDFDLKAFLGVLNTLKELFQIKLRLSIEILNLGHLFEIVSFSSFLKCATTYCKCAVIC